MELCIVTPTAKAESVPLVALDALLGQTPDERNQVAVLSADTSVRESFRELAPPAISVGNEQPYAEGELPVANIRPDGKLSSITGDSTDLSRFLFSYTSKRLPGDRVSERVACLFVDDSVKITSDRLEKFYEWKGRNEVPAIVYFTSDPVGDIFETVGERGEVWTWSRELLEAGLMHDSEHRSELKAIGAAVASPDGEVVNQLQNRVSGVEMEVNVPGGDKLDELLQTIQTRRYEFEKLVREFDTETLWNARSSLRYATRDFEELLSPIDLAELHASRRSITTRLNQLERYASEIGSDPEASPAAGTYRDVVDSLRELRNEWPAIPEGQKKEGQLAAHLISISDADESVVVVAASDAAAGAVVTHLQADYPELYSDLGGDLFIFGPGEVRSSSPVDHVILYGAPRYGHRDLLRLSVSSHVIVLAYPTELRLLRSQVDSLNEALESATDGPLWDLTSEATSLVRSEDVVPTPESVDLRVPGPDERNQSSTVDGVSVRADSGDTDIADIVRTFDPDYLSADRDPIGETDSEPARAEGGDTVSCIALTVGDGGTLYYRPDDEVPILRSDLGEVLDKRAESVSPGEVVLHFEDDTQMRERLYSLIKDRGDAQLVFHAESWRVFLERAIAERGDDLDTFVERVNEHLDPDSYKTRQTYRKWYNQEVRRTRSKKSMWAMVKAYDLSFVEENFETVWNAVHTMEKLYKQLRETIEEQAVQATKSGEYEDVVVSEHPRIHLSDFDVESHVGQYEIVDTRVSEEPQYKVGMYERGE
jgi:hypothetical protein